MAKAIHMMVRVRDGQRSVDFYEAAFGLKIADRFDFDDFSLVYLRNAENELRGRAHRQQGPHGAVPARRSASWGLNPAEIKEFHREGALMARFFFVQRTRTATRSASAQEEPYYCRQSVPGKREERGRVS